MTTVVVCVLRRIAYLDVSWEAFYRTSGNPNEPTVAEIVERALRPAEAAEFKKHLRSLVERGEGTGRWAVAYLAAEK